MPRGDIPTTKFRYATQVSRPLNSIQFAAIPNIKYLMAKAPFKQAKNAQSPVLPNNQIEVSDVSIDAKQLELFHQVVDWQYDAIGDAKANTKGIHPCFIHALGFPLQLALLLQADFPFKLLGLVHVDNKIRQYRPIKSSESLNFVCRFGELTLHRKGWLFSVVVECNSAGECVWQSTSTNLYRVKHGLAVPTKAPLLSVERYGSAKFAWQLAEDLGRRYAKASGDYNPIHLRKWTAKLLGFKQQIAHGMWTKSKCISQLQQYQAELFEQGFEVECAFKQPLYLPAIVDMGLQTAKDSESSTTQPVELEFIVESAKQGEEPILYLTGNFSIM